MKLDFNLQVTQKQGIALTAQVQQAIKLLHMTNMEIQEYVYLHQFVDEEAFSPLLLFVMQKYSLLLICKLMMMTMRPFLLL